MWQIKFACEAQSIQINLNVSSVQSQKLSSAMIKLDLMRIATGNEDPELPLLQRLCSLELTAPQIAAQTNASQSSSNRHISTSTVQRRLCESGLHGWIAAKKPLLKDTNKKRLALAKKNKQWTLDWGKFFLWSDESKYVIFGSNWHVFERRRVGERMISAYVVPTIKHGGGGVMVLCHITALCSDTPSHPVCA